MLGSAESQVPKLISREIISQNSNACDHNPPMLQTDGQLIMAIPRYTMLRTVKRCGRTVTDVLIELMYKRHRGRRDKRNNGNS